MSTEGIVLLLGGLGTFVGAVVAAVRLLTGDRFQRKVTESSNLLSGYTEQVKTLRQDIDSMRAQHSSDLQRLVEQHQRTLQGQMNLHEAERGRWSEERDRLEERIDTLETQVASFLMRPPTSRERETD